MKICTQQAKLYKDTFNCDKCACCNCDGELYQLDDDSSVGQLLTVMQKDSEKFYLPD